MRHAYTLIRLSEIGEINEGTGVGPLKYQMRELSLECEQKERLGNIRCVCLLGNWQVGK